MTAAEYRDSKGLLANTLFQQGYNCAQAVFCAFAEELSLDREMAAKLASSFGGGMGRLREVCGAVSGMFLSAGLLCGYSDPKAMDQKKEHYQRIQSLAAAFRQKNGSIVCRELLSASCPQDSADRTPDASVRTEEYYKKRPCAELVADAARITADLFYPILMKPVV